MTLKNISRRSFLAGAATTAAGAVAGCGLSTDAIEAYLQNNFQEMPTDELSKVIQRLERKYRKKYGRDITVEADPPMDGVTFAYALDISRCIGCRKCVYGCVEENNQSRNPQIHWIKVLEMDKSKGVDLHDSNPYYDPDTVPEEGKFYLPVQCQQCENPPCVKVCPVNATWTEKDGIVAIDYDWCVGCRCCVTACPYGARHFNWSDPTIPDAEINPRTHYLGNRPRAKGVVEKCTFCIQRIRKGLYPKCVEVCPVGARKFGNLLDPNSEIRSIIDHKRIFVLKKELGTMPKFFYFYGS